MASGHSSGPQYNAIFNFGNSASDTGNLCIDGRPGPAGVAGIFTRMPYRVTYFRRSTCRCSDARVNIDFLDCKDYLAKSLFVVQLGENDYSIQLVNGSTVDEAIKDIPRVVDAIISGVEKLITFAAVDILVSNIAPMGCLPLYLNIFRSSDKSDYDKYGCLRNYNALFTRHNSFLQRGLSKLQKNHPCTRIMYANLASHIYQIVQDPRKFGFDTALTSCCGKARAPHRFNLLTMCGMDGSSVCHDLWSHLTWDGMHLSDAALSGPYCHPPIMQ